MPSTSARQAPADGDATSSAERTTQYWPTQAGAWRLHDLLAEGTFCRVYAASPAAGPKMASASYALKILHPRWHDQPEALRLLKREAHVGRLVSHGHVAPVLSGQFDKPPYFVVMPRLAGQTLERRLQTEPTLPVRRALWIARQAAEGLAAIHFEGYLHGDVKPANIMLSPAGHATVIDLGFAAPIDDSRPAIERVGLGTLNYLAPELLTSAFRADERSDIYSLGAVLYEMLTGRPPYIARSLADLLALHRESEPISLRSIRPEAPAELAALVRRMLARQPLRRPHAMDDVARELMTLEIGALA